ncbi:MAG: hydroxymethylbilane synthase, partial [Gammaproteobacteria bacterium]
TRLQKLDRGDYDALVLASSGLARLDLGKRITQQLDRKIMLPAIGQGALGIETRVDDRVSRDIIAALNDENTSTCVSAERGVNRRLNGGCHAPIGAYAVCDRESITITALVGRLDGTGVIQSELTGPVARAEALGEQLGQTLLDKGAGDILDQLRLEGSL